jgi:hypothetical protein
LMVLVGTSSTASALFMGGSTPVKATGEGCYRNSDCPAAYACLRGVCEEECVENRDCSLGSVCKKVGGAGGQRLGQCAAPVRGDGFTSTPPTRCRAIVSQTRRFEK